MDREIDGLLGMYERGKVSRRSLVKALGALALGVPLGARAGEVGQGAGGPVGVGGVPSQPPIPVTTLNHVTTFVSDVPRTAAFYQELFGMPVVSDQGTGINLSAGSRTQFVGVYGAGAGTPRIDHLCLGVEGFDVERITGVLEERGVESRVRMRDGTVPEIYMSDPDGLSIQLQDPSYCGGSGALGNVCA